MQRVTCWHPKERRRDENLRDDSVGPLGAAEAWAPAKRLLETSAPALEAQKAAGAAALAGSHTDTARSAVREAATTATSRPHDGYTGCPGCGGRTIVSAQPADSDSGDVTGNNGQGNR